VKGRVLVVDDDPSLGEMLGIVLRQEGFEPVFVRSGDQAIAAFHQAKPDLVLLDLMLPGKDGLEICRELRLESGVPIVMLTAKTDTVDVVLGLESGADDYITKPFSVREFRSRVRAALRRAEMIGSRPGGEEPIAAGSLRIDFERRIVSMRRKRVQLTYVEFEILAALARSPGRVQTREMLLEQVWGDSAYRDPRTVDVHIRHLREKLERDPRGPEYLFTVRGVGYRFRDKDE
jgi:DNA-binding response OmpR family regulator